MFTVQIIIQEDDRGGPEGYPQPTHIGRNCPDSGLYQVGCTDSYNYYVYWQVKAVEHERPQGMWGQAKVICTYDKHMY